MTGAASTQATEAARRSAFISGFESDVYWWEPDGRVVRISPGDGVYSMACVHPDGTHAVFWGGASGRPRLWLADGQASAEPLTDADLAARYPAYDLSGRLLAYCISEHPTETIERLSSASTATMPAKEATMAIVVRNEEGRTWRLTDGRHQDQRPALSPDGSMVAFVSTRGGRPGLWLVATDGQSPPRVLLEDTRAYRPWWSVDGRLIYFFILGSPRHRVHAVSASGGEPHPLENDDRGDSHGPYADPDGRHLLIHSTRDRDERPDLGVWGLYELPLDGGEPRRLVPPGHRGCSHGTRARNGVVTFDTSRRRAAPREGSGSR